MRFAIPSRIPAALLASLLVATPVPAGPLAYIAHGGSHYVSVVDVTTRSVVRTIDVGFGPEGVAIAPNGAAVYVAAERIAPDTPT